MQQPDELVHEANALADSIRRIRSREKDRQIQPKVDLGAMQSQLASLWAQIRASRVQDSPTDISGAPNARRTYPKWR